MEITWNESKNEYGKTYECDAPYGDFNIHYFVGKLSETFMVMHESMNESLLDSVRVESYEEGFQKVKEKYETRLSKITKVQKVYVTDDCALITRGIHENPYNTVLASMCRLFRHFYFSLSATDSRSELSHNVCVKDALKNLEDGLSTIEFLKKHYTKQNSNFKDHFQYVSSMRTIMDDMDNILPYIPSTVISSEPVAMNLQDEEMIYGKTSATYNRHQFLRTKVYDGLIQKGLPLEKVLDHMYLLVDYLEDDDVTYPESLQYLEEIVKKYGLLDDDIKYLISYLTILTGDQKNA